VSSYSGLGMLLGKVMINGWVLICEIAFLLGTAWYEGSCFTDFCKVVCRYGVWQAGLGGSLHPDSVLRFAVLFGIGFV
jgi:hypothetical protein